MASATQNSSWGMRNVGSREVQTLRAGRRNGVPGVPGQEEVAVAHRLADVAAELQHHLVEDLPLPELEPVRAVDALLQFGPDRVRGPGGRVLVGRALEIHPLDVCVPLADQREPVLGVAVDQLRRAGGRLAQDPEPGERVFDEVVGALLRGDRPLADALGAVRADDSLRRDLQGLAVGVREPDLRPGR